jgi:hypothetical protein
MKLFRSVLTPFLAALMACLPLVGSDGAMLSPVTGTVAVNGQAVSSTVLKAGDNVAISPDGTAQLTLNGATVTAAAKTRFRLEPKRNAISLAFGGVDVSGNLAVQTATRTIEPLSRSARFTVTKLHGPVYVIANSGDVKILAFGRSYTVREGEAATFQDQNAASSDQNNQGGAAAPTGSQTTTTTTTTATGTTGGTTVALPVAIGVAAGAAIITGVIVHSVTSSNNSSPSQ